MCRCFLMRSFSDSPKALSTKVCRKAKGKIAMGRGRSVGVVAMIATLLLLFLRFSMFPTPSATPEAAHTAHPSSHGEVSGKNPPPKTEDESFHDPIAVVSLAPLPPSRQDPVSGKRMLVPLLITHARYHGTSLLATTIKGWIKQFLVPQKNVDLVIFYVNRSDRGEIVSLLGLTATTPDPVVEALPRVHEIPAGFRFDDELDAEDAQRQVDGGPVVEWFSTPHDANIKIRLKYSPLRLPPYIRHEPELLNDPTWMRCGCPPVCPLKRSTVQYIQGTRWYTYDLMREPMLQYYHYWMKLDVDIWFYRPPQFNMVDRMAATGAIFAHTGKKYNGAGCSANLHKALLAYAKNHSITIASANSSWWRSDDDTYYSNFVVSDVEFHLEERYLNLAKYLNNYREGFFKHRWTDQSLFHKVFGMFFGPKEEDFGLDWSELRCLKKGRSPKAIFWHSKQSKKGSALKRCL